MRGVVSRLSRIWAIATNTVRNHFRAQRAQPRGVTLAQDFPDHRSTERQAELREQVGQVEREIREVRKARHAGGRRPGSEEA